MQHTKPDCLGKYDFDRITFYARKRFVEGHSTIELLQQANSTIEKEEIALVAMLDLDETLVKNLTLDCQHASQCRVSDCQKRIRQLLDNALAA